MKQPEQEMLETYNDLHPEFSVETVSELKGKYIPEERSTFEMFYGKECVTRVFGEASHLEYAKIMLLKIEEGKINQATKYEYLISIAYEISNACGKELDSNSPIWDKYAVLYAEIPIEMVKYKKTPLWYPGLKKEKELVTADELNVAKNWLSSNEAKTNLAKKIYLEQIFELVHISLKDIFEEVEQEIMGE